MLLVSLTLSLAGCSQRQSADLILSGGQIYTMNPQSPQVEAVAVKGDRIIYTGAVEGAYQLRDSETRIIDLMDMTVIPGLVDAHAHLFSLGRSLHQLNLVGTTSSAEIRSMVLDKTGKSSAGVWIQGRGWDQNDWINNQFPSWRDLLGTELHPVYLRRVDGHAAWVNKTALEICGITKDTPDPAGGIIIRDSAGEPTGVFIDNAIELISLKIPQPTNAERSSWLAAAIDKCHSVGLVGMHDAAVDSVKMEIYMKLVQKRQLKLRVYAMLSVDDINGGKAEDFLYGWFDKGPFFSDDHYFTVRSVKLFADGALGSRGAALLQPYSDDPGNSGLMVEDPEFMLSITQRALESGFQVCTHAIGDAANRSMLDIYEKALKNHSGSDPRLRIEHCQVLSLDDVPRFAELGVIPSMQPTHATSDMPWAEDRLGSDRVKGAYAWRKLLDTGCRIPCGSDFPVELPDPLLGIYAAVTRQDCDGNPQDGWFPEERMSVEEAVRGFTVDAAYASFAEDISGSIEAGKLADFTILDKDIFNIPLEQILDTHVRYTIIGGEVVFGIY